MHVTWVKTPVKTAECIAGLCLNSWTLAAFPLLSPTKRILFLLPSLHGYETRKSMHFNHNTITELCIICDVKIGNYVRWSVEKHCIPLSWPLRNPIRFLCHYSKLYLNTKLMKPLSSHILVLSELNESRQKAKAMICNCTCCPLIQITNVFLGLKPDPRNR